MVRKDSRKNVRRESYWISNRHFRAGGGKRSVVRRFPGCTRLSFLRVNIRIVRSSGLRLLIIVTVVRK
jgi:hypothetical protein